MVRNSKSGVNKMVGVVKRRGLQTTTSRFEVLFFLEYRGNFLCYCYEGCVCFRGNCYYFLKRLYVKYYRLRDYRYCDKISYIWIR